MTNSIPGEGTAARPVDDMCFVPGPAIRAGRFEVRMARDAAEVREAQRLRYRVMYAEKGGKPDLEKVRLEADVDEWDAIAFHVVVFDTDNGELVGTLRLVSNHRLTEGQAFYTEQSFDLSGLRQRFHSLLELGRFCIDARGRQGAILMLIWKYTMQFIVENQVEVMLGCASFPGTDAAAHRDVLGYLFQHNRAPESLRPIPVVGDYVPIADLAGTTTEFEGATRDIPTLLRGYLKLGARVSDVAIQDPVFNTTFICIYVETASMLNEQTVLVTSRRGA